MALPALPQARDGDDPIDFEDADSTLHFFFPKDYAYAAADSITDFSNRVGMRRYFYSDHGKDYMLVGVPWSWIDSAPEGNLIIDPTTNAATSVDVRLYDGSNYGNDTKLAVGKFPNASNYKAQALISFDQDQPPQQTHSIPCLFLTNHSTPKTSSKTNNTGARPQSAKSKVS